MNVYDFDGTIYHGDCSVDFFLFVLKRKRRLFFLLPRMGRAYLLCRFGKMEKKACKEVFFSFLREFDDPVREMECFAARNRKKIKKWYLAQMKKDDVIITASPEPLVQLFFKELLGQKCLGTRMDMRTGRIYGENCRGVEKVIRFQEEYGEKPIDDFYTDSRSDMPMAMLARHAYLVKRIHTKDFCREILRKI